MIRRRIFVAAFLLMTSAQVKSDRFDHAA